MQNLQEKIKEMLLLSDNDIEPLLKGDFKTLLSQNKEAAIRTGIAFAGVLIAVLLFLSLFSFFGAFGKIVLVGLFFGTVGLIAFLHRNDLLEKTKYPICSYFLVCIFGLMMLSMFSSVSTQGSFFSKLLMLLILGSIGAGVYIVRPKATEAGASLMQLIVVALAAGTLLLSLQVSAIQFSVDQELSMAQRRSEMRRQRDAEQMSRNQASMKICASEEECRKMNTKKNSYYSEYEDAAQEICESAVAKEMPGRFEWTVSAKDYKFNKYEVDVLKDEITLFGDRAQLISNGGAKQKVAYACRYNTKKKTAAASVQKPK